MDKQLYHCANCNKDYDFAVQGVICPHRLRSEGGKDRLEPWPKKSKPERMDFVAALKIAEGVFEKYRADQPKWWKKMDGTPILNDVSVRMAEAFRAALNGGELL